MSSICTQSAGDLAGLQTESPSVPSPSATPPAMPKLCSGPVDRQADELSAYDPSPVLDYLANPKVREMEIGRKPVDSVVVVVVQEGMGNPEYQQAVDLAVNLPEAERPLTAEYFVDWLIEYKGLPPEARENVVSNLKRDYQRVELQGALKQAMAHPQVVVGFSLFGAKK